MLELLMYFILMLSLMLKLKSFLMMLLNLEMIVLLIFIMIYMEMCSDYYISMIYLFFSVSESILGLSILVIMIRCYGVDMLMLFNILW